MDYQIVYNRRTGYYNIEFDDGTTYGEYLTYDDAESDVNSVGRRIEDETDEDRVDSIEEESDYIVQRYCHANHTQCVMFSLDRRRPSKNVIYSLESPPDPGVSAGVPTYSELEAKEIAKRFNELSKKNNLHDYTNWEAVKKWW